MRMLRCLIVDDEPMILGRLERFFQKWASVHNRYCLAGKAYSGNEAVELAHRLQPDIILTDIVMPGMDGIEMIRQVKQVLPNCEFIILSAYSDFHYAKQAISLNVVDYLVKVPLKEQELYDILERVRANVLQKEESNKKTNDLHMMLHGNIHRLRKQWLEELSNGELTTKMLENKANELMPGFTPANCCCIVIRIDDFHAFQDDYNSVDQSRLVYGMLNIAEEVMRAAGGSFACASDAGHLAGFVSLPFNSVQKAERAAIEVGSNIHYNIKQYLNVSVSVGISRSAGGWEVVGRLYAEAREAVQDAFHTGRGSIIAPGSRLDYPEEAALRWKRTCDQLLRDVAAAGFRATLDALQAQLAASQLKPIAPVKLTFMLKDLMGKWMEAAGGDGNRHDVPPIESYRHIDQVQEAVIRYCRSVVSERQGSGVHPEIGKAKQFIESRLAEQLSLSIVASAISMNATYLSELFKKETKENFTDYVNRLRIERSIKLLKIRDYPNWELAGAVGLHNEKYFCTLFKKHTGLSPQKYRKKMLE
ncbi:response regulator [Paenibacillus sp. GCM10027626]|uniref:response regulator n=1 Tax=Paenibacillus sp. GCM10027626 TaxID=3273411 RepID=UPI00362EEA56